MRRLLSYVCVVVIMFLSGCSMQNNTQNTTNNSYDKKMGIFISPTISKKIIRQQIMAAKSIDMQYVRIPIDQMPFNGKYAEKTRLANYAIKISLENKMKIIVDFTGGNPGNYEETSTEYTNIINEDKANIAEFIKNNSNKKIIWESWNEPQGEFWSNERTRNINSEKFIAEWINMNDYIARTVSKYDHNAKFINGNFSGSPLNNNNFVNSVLNSSGMKKSSAISFHPYLKKDLNNGRPEELLNEFPISSKVPYIVTEFGYPIKTTYSAVQENYLGLWSRREQAEYLVRATLIFNIMRMPYYALFTTSLNHDNFGIEDNGKLNFAGKKLKEFNKALQGYTLSEYFRKGEVFVTIFHKKYRPYKIVAWSADDKKHKVKVRDTRFGNLKLETTGMPKMVSKYSTFSIVLFIGLVFGGFFVILVSKSLWWKKGR